MAVTLQELLAPQFILDLISRIRPRQGQIGKWLGFQPNSFNPESVTLSGPATIPGNLRNVTYRIFNYNRTVPTLRAPATGPNTIPQTPMAQVSVTCCRFHDKIPLNYEFLNNLSPMTGPNSQIDPMGQNYIKQQTKSLAEKYATGVEMLSAAMMRDALYILQTGDQWLPSFTAPTGTQVGFQVPFQIPAGNKDQLNMLGTGNIIATSWANPAAPMIDNIMSIKAAFSQLSGYAMTDIWINSIMWSNVLKNTQVRNTGGSSNVPFAEYINAEERGMDGKPTGRYEAILRADPTVTWHIDDDIVALGGQIDPSYAQSNATAAKLIPDTMAIFTTLADPEIAKMYLGGEPVVENPGMPAVLRTGYYFWHEYTTQPSAVDLLSLLNAVPCLYNPLVFAPGTVVF